MINHSAGIPVRVKQPFSRAVRITLLVAIASTFFCAVGFAANQYVLPTNPPTAGASVFVDGTYAGATDQNGKVVLTGADPGVHLVRVEAGRESYTEEMTFDADLNALPPFNLVSHAPPPGTEIDYSIDANLADAEVDVDGAPRGTTDTAGQLTLRLTPGQSHRIEIRKTGYETHSETITPAGAGKLKIEIKAQAEPPPHRVDVLLIVLVVLLVGSVTLLIAMLLRHRARTAAAPAARVQQTVVEQTGGIFDRYRLIAPLGTGGVATIYRGYDLIDKAAIALKVLDARWLSDPEMVRKFLAEGEALHAIAKRDAAAAVVKCFRYGREHDSIVGRPFIALELLEGETLQSRLDREPRLDPVAVTAVAYQIAFALVAVHDAGIVHRDLTPDNVFLKKGELTVGGIRFAVPLVVLIDFGIARQELMSRMTLDGSIAGKPHYMSPEQCRGIPVDTRGDLYSLGVILYLMVAGRLPFPGRDPFEVMRAQMSDAPPPMSGDADLQFADLCNRLLQKAPEHRPQSAAGVAQELEQMLFSISASPSMNVVTFPTRRVSL